MNKHLYCAALVLLWLTGCSARINGLVSHESFTYPAIVQGKMAIGGVTSSIGAIKKDKEFVVGSIIYASFLDSCRECSIIQMGDVVDRIGNNLHSRALREYQQTGSLTRATLDELQPNLTGIRYVIFARIDDDSIEQIEEIHYSTKDDKSSDRSVAGGKELHIKQTSRRETVSLHIFDLTSGIMAWGGSVTASNMRQHSYNTTQDDDHKTIKQMATDILIETAKDAIESQLNWQLTRGENYPYISQETVLREAFLGFAENLPTNKAKKENARPPS